MKDHPWSAPGAVGGCAHEDDASGCQDKEQGCRAEQRAAVWSKPAPALLGGGVWGVVGVPGQGAAGTASRAGRTSIGTSAGTLAGVHVTQSSRGSSLGGADASHPLWYGIYWRETTLVLTSTAKKHASMLRWSRHLG